MRQGWTKVELTGVAITALAAGTFAYFRSDRDQAAPAPAALQPVPVIATTVQQHADHADRPRNGHSSQYGDDR
jgi:hypothetical protein